ncbi:adhesin transport system outer membrane protein [Litoreibacter ponti]|uniref:Adhesin transport system outer membrane protein n=1 Tax=Litoreibacter ponti TaxID=1510457 RepID=A0A2T6BJT2_9RHOB|nr:TolC family protein [Litoreibacter ponti]PTX56292.1 adhesin transport system outer membrane protein [Litoreibacter ponti]
MGQQVGQARAKALRMVLAGTALIAVAGCMGNEATRDGFAPEKPATTENMRTTGRFAERVQSGGETTPIFGFLKRGASETPTRNANSLQVGENLGAPVVPAQPALAGGTGSKDGSQLIETLLKRQSVLDHSTPYGKVAGAVLAANSRAAEAELRAAKLRNEAASKNWLPTIGPAITLSSLGEMVASMVIDQVLFDNGRKKGERAFAKADVEVAAVALAEDTNDRVFTALELYLTAERARAQAAAGSKAAARMGEFTYIMERRVRGGVSGPADLQVLRQKLAQTENTRSSDMETARTAIAELNAMSLRPLGDVRGLASVSLPKGTTALPILKAEAEMERDIAQAKLSRAGFLPGVNARATVTDSGTDAGLTVGAPNGFGFGTKASLKAIEAAKDAASRRVDQASEDQARTQRRLEQTLVSLKRQQAQGEGLVASANANLQLFDRQYQAGQRPVMDVVRVFETKVRTDREQIALRYEIALVELQLAHNLGLLVDGEDI